jgi:hypothetical protein
MSTPFSQPPSDEPENQTDESSETTFVDRLDTIVPEPAGEALSAREADFAEGTPREETAAYASPKTDGGSRGLTVLLLILLLASLAFNGLQWRAQSRLSALSNEFEIALTQAVEKLDEQTLRALAAEGTLSNVDGAMNQVRVRIAGLQDALDELAAATER